MSDQTNLRKMNFSLHLVFLLSTGVAYFGYFLNWGSALKHDWLYFNIFGYILRSQVFGFGIFPFHNPYLCGGLDLLVNPQTRYFSPLVVLDLLFEPFKANLLSFVFYSFAGHWGAYLLLRHLKLTRSTSILGAMVFVNCSWFGLHFAEGHVVLGVVQLIPFILFATYNISRPSMQVLLTLIFAWLAIDPAFYGIVLALFSVISLLVIHPGIVRDFRESVKRTPFLFPGLCVAILLISSVKLFPFLVNHMDMERNIFTRELSLFQFKDVFFNPFQETSFRFNAKNSMLEYGCYVGVLSFLLVCLSFFRREFMKVNYRYGLVAFFWFTEAAGFLQPYSFWNFYQKIPILRNVSSTNCRALIIFFVFYLIIWMRALDGIKKSKIPHAGKIFIIFFIVFVSEAFFVRNYPTFSMYREYRIEPRLTGLLLNDNLERTVTYAGVTGVLRVKNTGVKYCYESVVGSSSVASVDDNNYRGEIYLVDGRGQARLNYYSYGNLTASFNTFGPARIRVNTNYLNGWRVVEGNARIEPSPDSPPLLDIIPQTNYGTVRLNYRPWYFEGTVAAYFSGWILLAFIGFYSMRTDRRQYRESGTTVFI